MVQVPPYSELAVGVTPGSRVRLRPTLKGLARKQPTALVMVTGPLCRPAGTVKATDSSTALEVLTIPIAPPIAVRPPGSLMVSGPPLMLKPTTWTVSPGAALSGFKPTTSGQPIGAVAEKVAAALRWEPLSTSTS